MATAQAGTTDPGVRPKLRVDRVTDGPVTCLRLAGTIDEQFDGKSIVGQLSGRGIVLLDLGEIERISSFGIREWVDFIVALKQRASSLWFVECAPKVIDQFNMVANFGGEGHLVSFYAPFRCDYCDDDRRRLLRVTDDWEQLRSGKLPERNCESCGNAEYFDEDPLTFFSYVQQHAPPALPPEVVNFLAERLQYTVDGGARKLKIEKQIDGRATYLKLTGDLDGTFPTDKLAEGLEGDVLFDLHALGRIDPAGAAEWRQLVARATPIVDRLVLCRAPAAFVERLGRPEELGQKGVLASLLLPYSCPTCRSTTARELDVAADQVSMAFLGGTGPQLACHDCKGPLSCVASDALLALLPSLPAPNLPAPLLDQLGRFQKEAQRQLLAQKPAVPTLAPLVLPTAKPSSGGGISWATVMAAVAIIVVLGGGFLVWQFLHHHSGGSARVEASEPNRPAWVDQTFFHDGERLLFVGRSALLADKADGFDDAEHAALEELALQLGLGIRDAEWNDTVRTQFDSFRAKAIGDLEKAALAGGENDLERARRAAKKGRGRVAESLRKTGGALVPAERDALYWEKMQTGDGLGYQVWVRYAMPKATFDKLIERYSVVDVALGAKLVTYFPEMAWRFVDVTEGAMVIHTAEDSALRFAGVQVGDLVLSGQDRPVHDAPGLRRLLDEESAALAASPTGGTLKLKVQRGDAPAVETRLKVVSIAPPKPVSGSTGKNRPSNTGQKSGSKSGSNGNIWDDNPDN